MLKHHKNNSIMDKNNNRYFEQNGPHILVVTTFHISPAETEKFSSLDLAPTHEPDGLGAGGEANRERPFHSPSKILGT